MPSAYYDQLVRYINESTFPEGSTGYEKYGNMNVEEALLLYFKQPHIQAHMEELEKYRRENKVIIPRSNFVFQKEDKVVFLAKKDSISVVENIFRISSI